MYKNRSRGFTLIELLVVIAIIGILSAVVLASLNTARQKGNNAAVKANLDTIRTQSVIYADSNKLAYNSTGFTAGAGLSTTNCAITGSLFKDPNVWAAILAADSAAGGDGVTPTKVVCGIASGVAATYSLTVGASGAANASTLWIVWAPMIDNSAATGWCVDYTGVSKIEPTVPGSGIYSCP